MAEILVEILVSASGSSKSILLHYETITPSFLERTEQSWKFTDLQANNFQSFLYFFLISAAHTHKKNEFGGRKMPRRDFGFLPEAFQM